MRKLKAVIIPHNIYHTRQPITEDLVARFKLKKEEDLTYSCTEVDLLDKEIFIPYSEYVKERKASSPRLYSQIQMSLFTQPKNPPTTELNNIIEELQKPSDQVLSSTTVLQPSLRSKKRLLFKCVKDVKDWYYHIPDSNSSSLRHQLKTKYYTHIFTSNDQGVIADEIIMTKCQLFSSPQAKDRTEIYSLDGVLFVNAQTLEKLVSSSMVEAHTKRHKR